MLRLRRILLGALPALVLGGCLSPTLPLPPPDQPDVEQIAQGQYRLTGEIPVAGTILALDTRTNLIFGKVVRGGYQLDIAAQAGDTMTLWYEQGDDVSDITTFRIPQSIAPFREPDGGAP